MCIYPKRLDKRRYFFLKNIEYVVRTRFSYFLNLKNETISKKYFYFFFKTPPHTTHFVSNIIYDIINI